MMSQSTEKEMKKMKKFKINKLLVAAIVVVAVIITGTVAVSAATAFVESQSIGVGNAVELALSNAGINESDAEITKAKLSLKSGGFVYTVNFRTADEIYRYELDSKSGEVLSVTVEPVTNGSGSATGTVSLDEAKQTAAKTLGLSVDSCVFTSVKTEREDGTKVYEIEFYTVNEDLRNYYEFEIAACGGAVIKYDAEENIAPISAAAVGAGVVLTEDEAKNIASERLAGLGLNPEYDKTELDYEKGAAVYKVGFISSKDNSVTDYEVYVLAFDGTVIKTEYEYEAAGVIQTPGNNNGQGSSDSAGNSTITLGKAKQIAFEDAGVNENGIRLKKAQYERDDGRYVFEIEFIYNGFEYEYKIDSNTGKIIEKEIDND